MARYNSATLIQTISAAATINSPLEGSTVKFTGSTQYTVNLPAPALYIGIPFTFYNANTQTVTLSTPSGSFVSAGGSSASTQTLLTTATTVVASDGNNYVVLSAIGGPVSASTLTASSTVTLSPANANVTISPSGTGIVTMAPAAAGSLNNVTIGQTTALAGSFTSLSASGTTTLGQITEILYPIASYGTSQSTAFTNGDVFYLTGMTGNFTFNWTGVPTTANRTFTLTLILGQGGTAYVPTTLQINSSGVTINWAGGVTGQGRANKIDIVSFFIYYTGGTFTAVGAVGSYG
jgi:hypothetical protein